MHKCGCGREFLEEKSMLQHKKDAHGEDTDERIKKLEAEGTNVPKVKIKKKNVAIYSVVAVLLLAGVFFALAPSAPAPAANAVRSPSTPSNGAAFFEEGDPGAPNLIEEFGDYECPFCARFHLNTFPQIKRDFIDTGKVRYVFRDFPLSHAHLNAQKAAEAAHCAGDQGKYSEYHDKLYANSYSGDRWANKPSASIFKRYAADLSLDTQEFSKCIDSGAKAGEVRAGLLEGQRRGVSGTPTFFVNGRLVSGAQPYDVFARLMK